MLDIKGHTSFVTSAVFSPDGSRILTSSLNGIAKLWDLKGNLLGELKHNYWLKTAIFSPKGTYILTASEDGAVKLWDFNGNLLAKLNRHTNWVKSICFSPDESRILTASDDNTAKIWLTPEAIYEWLKTAPIPQLSEKDKK